MQAHRQRGRGIGVGAGALVIPFILNLLNQAFGFEGGPPAIVEGAKTLAAPQATLISALARGVIGGTLIGILVVSLIGLPFGLATFGGIVAPPPSRASVPFQPV